MKRPSCVSLLVLMCLLLAGCGQQHIETRYGKRKGPGASRSVNGTAVLASMFEQAGHTVISRDTLSPRVNQQADCIVWFPDDFDPPSDEVRTWLDNWLEDAPNRTLIYVGRDYDAAPHYWQQVLPGAPAGQTAELRRRLAEAKSDFKSDRSSIKDGADCEWFTIDDSQAPRKVRTLEAAPSWLEDVDPAKVDIELNSRIQPTFYFDEWLLQSEGDMLIARDADWCNGRSQQIIVTNGSFLLNLPLVNHEHRKLAGRLIDEVGPTGQTVVFLESYAGGPVIHDEEPQTQAPSGLAVMVREPMVWIFLHLALAGIIFCFARWPIFGLPRRPQPRRLSDFGKHLEALGELLSRSGDRSFAMSRVLHYQQTTRPGEER